MLLQVTGGALVCPRNFLLVQAVAPRRSAGGGVRSDHRGEPSLVGRWGNMKRVLLVAWWLCAAVAAQAAPEQTGHCRSAAFTAELRAGHGFQKAIANDLLFRLTQARLGSEGELTGWEITVTPAKEPGKDYIYPVTLHFVSTRARRLERATARARRHRWRRHTRCTFSSRGATTIASSRFSRTPFGPIRHPTPTRPRASTSPH